MRGDLVLDLGGDRLLPGLINAHDHLQLNHFPALEYPALYGNATQWIEDFNARLRYYLAVGSSAAVPRAQRLLGGGLKILSGVTTVAAPRPARRAAAAAGSSRCERWRVRPVAD